MLRAKNPIEAKRVTRLQKETGETITEITSAQYHIDWIKDRLTFDNDRLSDIIISLKGWYAVQIDCPQPFLRETTSVIYCKRRKPERDLTCHEFDYPYEIHNQWESSKNNSISNKVKTYSLLTNIFHLKINTS